MDSDSGKYRSGMKGLIGKMPMFDGAAASFQDYKSDMSRYLDGAGLLDYAQMEVPNFTVLRTQQTAHRIALMREALGCDTVVSQVKIEQNAPLGTPAGPLGDSASSRGTGGHRTAGTSTKWSDGSDDDANKQKQERITEYLEKSALAYSILTSSLDKQHQLLVEHIPRGYAYGVWKVLEDKYERSGAANTTALIQQLHGMSMSDTETWDLWHARVVRQVSLLKDNGEPTSYIAYKELLFGRLPSRYGPTVQLVRAHTEAFAEKEAGKVVDTARKLFAEYEHQIGADDTSNTNTALYAGGGRSGGRGARSGNGGGASKAPATQTNSAKGIKCYGCQKFGHYKADCPETGGAAAAASSSGRGRKPVCGKCSKVGHTTAQHRDNWKPHQAQKSNDYEDDSANIAYGLSVVAVAKTAAVVPAEVPKAAPAQNDADAAVSRKRREAALKHAAGLPQHMRAGALAQQSKQQIESRAAALVRQNEAARDKRQREKVEAEREHAKPSYGTAGKMPKNLPKGHIMHDLVVDTGCTKHMTGDKNMLSRLRKLAPPQKVCTASGEVIEAEWAGSIETHATDVNGQDVELTIKQVLYIPTVKHTLISLSQLQQEGWGLVAARSREGEPNARLRQPREGTDIQLECRRGLYILRNTQWFVAYHVTGQPAQAESPLLQLHAKCGHIHLEALLKRHKQLAEAGVSLLKPADLSVEQQQLVRDCVACRMAKGHRDALGHTGIHRGSRPMQVVHADLMGPITHGNGGAELVTVGVKAKYILTLVDDYSGYVWQICALRKSDVAQAIIDWHKLMHRQYVGEVSESTGENGDRRKPGWALDEFHSDNGTEFINKTLKDYFASVGVKMTQPPPNTAPLNGIAERMNRTMMETCRAMLLHSGLPKAFWPQAVMTAAAQRNRMSINKSTGKTAYDTLNGRCCDMEQELHVFGCNVLYHLDKSERAKLDPTMAEGIYLGWSVQKHAHVVYSLSKQRLLISRDVQFCEHMFTYAAGLSGVRDSQVTVVPITLHSASELIATESSAVRTVPVHSEERKEDNKLEADGQDAQVQSEQTVGSDEPHPVTGHTTKRDRRPVDRGPYVNSYSAIDIDEENEEGMHHCLYAMHSDPPTSYAAAMKLQDSAEWHRACESEMKALHENEAWVLVPRPPKGTTVLKAGWVLRKKTNSQGAVVKHKARVVAKGYAQVEGIDYNETFAATLKYKSFRVVLSLTASWDYELKQMDVDTAFLNASLDETVHMEQPEGFIQGSAADTVCLLKRALYGTKQAPHMWNEHINDFILIELEYQRTEADPCLYVKVSRSDKLMLMTLYVDDIQSAYHISDEEEWLHYKQLYFRKYKMKDLGDCEWILGMRITRDREAGVLWLDQAQYVDTILHRFNMHDSKPVDTPQQHGTDVLDVRGVASDVQRQEEMHDKPYSALVGSLLYAAMATRLDIGHAVQQLSKHMSAPTVAHWTAGKRVLRYLQGSREWGLVFGAQHSVDPMQVEVYADADWANDKHDRQSVSGVVHKLNGDVVSWTSKKQGLVAASTCEAEYVALAVSVQETKWLTGLLVELGLTVEQPTVTHCDNRSAVDLTHSGTSHERSKHIDIKFHIVREQHAQGTIQVQWIPTDDNQADILTKAVTPLVFTRHRQQLMEPSNAVGPMQAQGSATGGH
jgi:transposase InsO family protein